MRYAFNSICVHTVPARCLLLIAALGLAGCPRLELATRTLVVDGRDRTYEFYVPSAAERGNVLPLVVVLHGAGGTGNQIARATDFHELAETENFIVAYPDGLRRVWNYDAVETPNDVAFIEAVMDDLIANFAVDETRIYVVGVSNGGFLTHLLACESADRIAAAATVISALPLVVAESCEPASPVPLLLMNGTADPIVPFDARVLEAGPRIKIEVLPLEETITFWLVHNGVESEPVLAMLPDLVDDGTHTELRTYVDADSTAEVAAYIIHGGGHSWPGLQRDLNLRLFGITTKDFCATELIWDFFVRHQ